MPVFNLDILFVSGHFVGRPDGSEAQRNSDLNGRSL